MTQLLCDNCGQKIVGMFLFKDGDRWGAHGEPASIAAWVKTYCSVSCASAVFTELVTAALDGPTNGC